MNPKFLLDQAEALGVQVAARNGNMHRDVAAAINQLRADVIQAVPPEQRDWFAGRIIELDIRPEVPYPVEKEAAILACSQVVAALRSMREGDGPSEVITRVLPDTTRVFIVHGHDGESALRLQNLLRDRWGLVPVILAEQPQKGRSLIEKFEEEAGTCSFAIVLLTPDDFIEKGGKTYFQARPNVLFELGWFYGRLGRQRVTLLYKHGTAIPSDLGGIARIEFSNRVEEAAVELERELSAAGLLLPGGKAGTA